MSSFESRWGNALRKADRCVELRHKGDGNRPYGLGGLDAPVVLEKLNHTVVPRG